MAVYRPPDQTVREFVETLDSLFNILYRKANFELCIVGDTNINTLMQNQNTKLYREFMYRHGLQNIINLPTSYNPCNVEASLIDHYLTTDEELYSQNGVCPTFLSDHYVIFASRKKFKLKTKLTD